MMFLFFALMVAVALSQVLRKFSRIFVTDTCPYKFDWVDAICCEIASFRVMYEVQTIMMKKLYCVMRNENIQ